MSSAPDFVRKPDFFFATLTLQGALAFLLTAWVAPVLVSPDGPALATTIRREIERLMRAGSSHWSSTSIDYVVKP